MFSLRLVAFSAYLLSWALVAVGAVWSALPTRQPAPSHHHFPGMLLQIAGVLAITAFLPSGPLAPSQFELGVALALAPGGAILYAATIAAGSAGGLITRGPFAFVRHPMYLAFLLLLVATAALAAAGWRTVAAVALYLAGSELRLAHEEAALSSPAYEAYRRTTRWRYLPGLR